VDPKASTYGGADLPYGGEDATEVIEDLKMRLSGIVRLFEPLIRRQVPKQTSEVHRRFKEILEKST
jgi:hypothetical protein